MLTIRRKNTKLNYIKKIIKSESKKPASKYLFFASLYTIIYFVFNVVYYIDKSSPNIISLNNIESKIHETKCAMSDVIKSIEYTTPDINNFCINGMYNNDNAGKNKYTNIKINRILLRKDETMLFLKKDTTLLFKLKNLGKKYINDFSIISDNDSISYYLKPNEYKEINYKIKEDNYYRLVYNKNDRIAYYMKEELFIKNKIYECTNSKLTYKSPYNGNKLIISPNREQYNNITNEIIYEKCNIDIINYSLLTLTIYFVLGSFLYLLYFVTILILKKRNENYEFSY